MTDDPATHDFDWVTARDRCSLPNEFERLRSLVERDTAARKRCLPNNNSMDFKFDDGGPDYFLVMRHPVENVHGGTYVVTFKHRNDHILVEDKWTDRRLTLTLTLTDEGECRFMIDGEGEYHRWQVARRALCPIFFQGPAERLGASATA